MSDRARTSQPVRQRAGAVRDARNEDAAPGQRRGDRPEANTPRPRPRISHGSRRRARRLTLAPVALGLVAALLAGCSGAREPAPAPPVTAEKPSPTPTPPPTGPAKPERPAAMDKDDAEGAAAAAEYFIELYPYVMTTGDTSDWEAMSHAECGSCSDLIGDAKSIVTRGDIFVGGEVEASIDDPYYYVRDEQTGIYPLDLRVEQSATTITDKSGAELMSSGDEKSDRRIEMGRLEGNWIVVGIAEIPS
ncbi:DUF6318 family protein [Oerskovia turbata]